MHGIASVGEGANDPSLGPKRVRWTSRFDIVVGDDGTVDPEKLKKVALHV